MKGKISVSLIALYLLPWGIQCLINNFMPVYIASLPFATERTVGEMVGLGAVITAVSQLAWAFFAGKSRNKSNVLALSLLFLSGFSMLFLTENMTYTRLLIFVILFYSCYMAHQPLIDTIASENFTKTKHSFGFFRSFASLGYALMGFVFTFLPNENPKIFFLYTAILSFLSLVFSKTVSAKESASPKEERGSVKVFTPAFVKFLVYTFLLFAASSSISAFFSVYFTGEEYLGGKVGIFSLLVSVSAVAEWLLVILFGRWIPKMKSKWVFFLIPFSGIFRCLFIYIAKTPLVASFSFVFCSIWFGILWAAVTPYIKKNVESGANVFAQGLFTVVSSGAGGFFGSYISGIYAECFGLRTLFLTLTLVLVALSLLTPLLIKD